MTSGDTAALLLRKEYPPRAPRALAGGAEGRDRPGDRPVIPLLASGRRKTSGQLASNSETANLSGRVKWGHHPLAQEFINDLFDYYAWKLADIQMLAMLSCVFGESSTEDSVAYAENRTSRSRRHFPSMKAPAFSP